MTWGQGDRRRDTASTAGIREYHLYSKLSTSLQEPEQHHNKTNDSRMKGEFTRQEQQHRPEQWSQGLAVWIDL